MAFEEEFKREILQVKSSSEKVLKVLAIELFRSVISDTPVGNPDLWLYNHPTRGFIDYVGYLGAPEGYTGGHARSNWFLSFNSPSNRVTNSISSESTKVNQISRVINASTNRFKYILTNNLPYIDRLEMGYSTQAPSGMVARNVLRVEQLSPRLIAMVERQEGVS